MSSFHLEILTPFGHYFNGEVDYLEIRNPDGVLGILPRHTPIITPVVLGKVITKINGNKHFYATTGGLFNMKADGSASLMLNTIERSDEIDIERAKRSKERALNRIKNNEGNIKRAEDSLRRAENRLDVADDK
ncbi:MAG: F0F1 ATP synthase subunit epsilon [Bacilli bacterium]|nr:F0F1 ATP synthase subunit epsilon [Bacilli bacterium]